MHVFRRHLLLSLIALVLVGECAVAASGAPRRHSRPGSGSPLPQQERALHALNRLTFGPRPMDLAQVGKIGVDAWIEQQLHPESIDDSAFDAQLSSYPAMQLDLQTLIERYPSPALIRAAASGRISIPADPTGHAIYTDQIALFQQRQARQAAQKHGPSGNQDPGAASPASPQSEAASPSFEVQQERLYRDLEGTKIANLPPADRIARLTAMPAEELETTLRTMNREDRVALFTGLTPEQRETVLALLNPRLVVGGDLLSTRLLRDLYSNRQLEAVMADFWLNHFNVYIRKGPFAPWYLADFQNRVILPHALGKFEDLLVATAQSPAMLFYLDNVASTGPNSKAALANAGRNQPLGLNENYARELMELHTLGVDGGYTQRDVTEVAKVFTGWTIDRPVQGGGFVFNPRRHEPGPKTVLGHTIAAGGEQEGLEVLHLLATSPATAHFLSQELAVRFVSDDPPSELVERMAATYLSTGGDIREVLRTLFRSPEFWSPLAYRAKVKTPEEFLLSAVRATGGDAVQPVALVDALNTLGMPLYGCQPPNGYSWKAEAWLNSGDLLNRINFALQLAQNRAGTALHLDALAGITEPDATDPAQIASRLETALLNGSVSPETRQAVLMRWNHPPDPGAGAQQPLVSTANPPQSTPPAGGEFRAILMTTPPLPPPADPVAAALAGLLLGSPDFQRR